MVPQPAERSQGPPGRRRFRPRRWREYLELVPGRKHHVSGARGPGERGAPGGAQWLARGAVPPGAAVRAAAAPHILRGHLRLEAGVRRVSRGSLLGLVAAPAGACLRPGPAPSSLVRGGGRREPGVPRADACPASARSALAEAFCPSVATVGAASSCVPVPLRVSVLVKCIRPQHLCAGEAGRPGLGRAPQGEPWRRQPVEVGTELPSYQTRAVGVTVPSRCREN